MVVSIPATSIFKGEVHSFSPVRVMTTEFSGKLGLFRRPATAGSATAFVLDI
ncbi:MAG: hypothetical protein N3G20_06085 [Verrucomicrobiae bacterium]|nr:hypothetical protein [Verrucomicrobiae bacterium]